MHRYLISRNVQCKRIFVNCNSWNSVNCNSNQSHFRGKQRGGFPRRQGETEDIHRIFLVKASNHTTTTTTTKTKTVNTSQVSQKQFVAGNVKQFIHNFRPKYFANDTRKSYRISLATLFQCNQKGHIQLNLTRASKIFR